MQILKFYTKDQLSVLGNHASLVSVKMSARERYEYIKRLESEIISFSLGIKQFELTNDETSKLALWAASVRNLVHSARSLKSIRHDLIKLVRAEDDGSYKNKNELIKHTKLLYENIDRLLATENNEDIFEKLSNLEKSNETTHDKSVQYIYENYGAHISTPLNVVREIYSSNKALINALKEYQLDIDKITSFENLPQLVR